jgi:hypothetical protein
MFDRFLDLDVYMQVFWSLALVSTVVFLIQMVMTFIGLDSDTEMGSGFDDVEMEGVAGFFSFRNFVNFLLGYGWGGVLLQSVIPSMVLLEVAAVGVGLCFVLVFVILLRQVMKLSTDKTFQLEEAVGQIADTYLRIPSTKQGVGKVMVSVRGSLHEIEAMTGGEEIATGTKVRVVKVIGPELLEVERV